VRYIQCEGTGGPEVMRVAEAPRPEPVEHQVLIRVECAGVNRPDLVQRQGKYPPPPGASPVLGLEVAGTIVGTGARVCALTPGGGYAEYCVAPESHCIPVPANLAMAEAAGIPETFFTVWANVFQIGGLKAGERFLVHGGTSGIGTTAIQLARAFGATVYATAGTDAKCRACEQLGAERAINYREQDFAKELRGSVDVILDMVGGSYTARNIDCLAPRGRLVQIAVQDGTEATVNLAKIMQKRITLTGSTMRPRSVEDKAQIARELREHVWPLLESGKVKVLVDRVFPFEEAAEAHRYLEGGAHIGKVILKLD
jgi:putative PIG3 family NAD(P)H quinone oxidoreductase